MRTHTFVDALVIIEIPSLAIAISFLLNSFDATLRNCRKQDDKVLVLKVNQSLGVSVLRSLII